MKDPGSHNTPIAITGWGLLSPLGSRSGTIRQNLDSDESALREQQVGQGQYPVGTLSAESEAELKELPETLPYRHPDRTVQMAIRASQLALEQAGWEHSEKIGVNIGSSRGPTRNWELYHEKFLQEDQASVYSSPLTTGGSIATGVAQTLGLQGPAFGHSITCSTALAAIANAVAWIGSGMADRFLAGGSEAPITPFTLAQLKALGIYSKGKNGIPCQPARENAAENTMVLGEGAAVFALEKATSSNPGIAVVEAVGFGIEPIASPAGISSKGIGFETAMQQALQSVEGKVDAVFLHAPGTIQGDRAEIRAIERVFKEDTPLLITDKWKTGHLLGAAGGSSLAHALVLLGKEFRSSRPYASQLKEGSRLIRRVLINSAGFGGNAFSLVIALPKNESSNIQEQ